MKNKLKIMFFSAFCIFPFQAHSCEKREIKYVSFTGSSSVDEFIEFRDINVKLPIDSVSGIYYGPKSMTLFAKGGAVYSIAKYDLDEKLVESVFHLSKQRITDYCEFNKISEKPAINFFSGFLSADYSVFERFIIVKGVSLSGVNTEQIFFSIGKNKFGSIITLSNPNPDDFISDFIFLNKSDNLNVDSHKNKT